MPHVELVQSLTTDDPDAAEAAVRAHTQSGKEPLPEGMPRPEAASEPKPPAWL